MNSESFVHFLAPESADFVTQNYYKFVAGKDYDHFYRFWFIHASGEKRLLEKHMTDYFDGDGGKYLVISMLDITDREREAEEKARIQSQLQQAKRWKQSACSREVSHTNSTTFFKPCRGIHKFY